jgi:hypothetical protein
MAGIVERGVKGAHGEGDIHSVTVTKAKQELLVNTGDLPAEAFNEIIALGLKTWLNKGMGDVKTKDLEGEALAKAQAEALKFANENLAKLLSGEFKKSASKAAKVAGKVMTEAKRLARNFVKDQLKRAGHKVSHYPAAEITKAAVALIEADGNWVKMATESLDQAAQQKSTIDISAIKVDPKLVDKANAKKKGGEGKKPLSATQAGITAVRAKPTPGGQGPRPGQMH